jgi:hypothetical protein
MAGCLLFIKYRLQRGTYTRGNSMRHREGNEKTEAIQFNQKSTGRICHNRRKVDGIRKGRHRHETAPGQR